MISYTSNDCNKWGLVSNDGPRVEYEFHQPSRGLGCLVGLIALALIVLAVLAVLVSTGALTIFEDGSWAIGTFPYPVSGCLPFALCTF